MNVNTSGSNIVHEVMGNVPIPGPGKNGMMGGGGGVVPPALLEEYKVPKFYIDAIVACGATNCNMLPHTALVYNMMVTSGLQRSVLSYIWSAVNRTLPGQLTRPEFFSCLALIALAQKGESLAALSSMSQLPIPFFQTVQVASQVLPPPVVGIQSRPVQSKPKQETSLLPSKLFSTEKEVDLMGDVIPDVSPSTSTQPTTSDRTSSSSVLTPSTNSFDNQLSSAPKSDCSSYSLDDLVLHHDQDTTSVSGELSSDNIVQCAAGDTTIDVQPELSSEQLACFEKTILASIARLKEFDVLCKNASQSVLLELFSTEKGDQYLRCLIHCYSILMRIKKSVHNNMSVFISEEVKHAEGAWKRLERFVTEAMKEEEMEKMDGYHIKCSICYQGCSSPIDYGGKSYHMDCANLWVNAVQPILP